MLGLYPVWYEPNIGSGWVIGFIATIHVLFSHASVGGAILFGWLANRAVRKNRPEYIDFIRRYGLFLLVFSYVLGSITGPGIWFSATIANPKGISALIHSFVWMWATEWVFFVIEVIGIYLLIYLAGRVDAKTHTRLSMIFALASVATLLVITGILSFMLMPGSPDWHQTGGVLTAFFGPNTFAQVALRIAFMLTITGVVGGIVAAKIEDPAEKSHIARVLSAVGLIGVAGTFLAGRWYFQTLPLSALETLTLRSPSTFSTMVVAAVGLSVLWFLLSAAKPGVLKVWTASFMTVAILVLGLAPEETAREIMRKPWIAGTYVYANQTIGRDVPALGIKSDLPLMEEKGVLATHPFIPEALRNPTDADRTEAGRVLALTLCANCHSLSDSGIRPLKRYFPAEADKEAVKRYLGAGLHRGLTSYMPAIPLPDLDRDALAQYIAELTRSADAASNDSDTQEAAR